MDERIPLIEASGTQREIGRQVGEAAREVFARGVADYRERFPVLCGFPFEEAVERARAYERPMTDYLPGAAEQLRGMAEGAGVPFEYLMALNCSEEFTCAADWAWPPKGHCTSFAFLAGERVVSGHNEDWYPEDVEALVVRRVRVASGAEYISVGPAYYLPITGISVRGFSSAANTLYCRDERVGVPNNSILLGVLESDGVDEAAALIAGATRARGSNHLLAGADGRILDVETSATRLARLGDDACFSHTNHYLAPELALDDASRSEGSPLRLARAQELLAEGLEAGGDPVALAQRVLCDHANAPNSICAHVNDDDPEGDRSITTVSMVWEPVERLAHVAAGVPCEHEYVTYGL